MRFDPRPLHPDSIAMDTSGVRDISRDVLGQDGRLLVLPAAYWATTTWQERALFGHRHGLYSFPTAELVEYLRAIINGRNAIEIGAGHGVLSDALGIVGTDSFQQHEPNIRAYYEAAGQTIVPYGPNVVKVNASRAVRELKPKVVIGCWVTHKWDPRRPQAKGNEWGIDEADILRHCDEYVFVGNERTHELKPLWDRKPRQIHYPPFVYSRAHSQARELVAIWTGSHGKAAQVRRTAGR